MKKILNYSLLAVLLLLTASCEKGLEGLNKNKTNPTSIDPVLLLNNAVINTSFPTTTLNYDIVIVQQMVTTNDGVLSAANFNAENRSIGGQVWPTYYPNVIKNTHDVIVNTKSKPTRSNLYNMARIFQAYAFMILTDEYGDIPYNEGGAGYTDQIFFPKYDAQQSIYMDIIKELTEASAALSASGTIETSDVLYSGDIPKWKKFANSLLLRAGMRIAKADAAKAQVTVQAAFASGVITGNADNAYMRHDGNYNQPIGNSLNGSEQANYYLAKPFVDQLKTTNDPRLSAIAIRYVGATSGGTQTVAVGTTLATDQVGMPIGYNNSTIDPKVVADFGAGHKFYEYSQADRRRIMKATAPVFFVTAAQTNLLLAEARIKGWITTGTAAQYFSDGIKAHMDQMATFDAGCAVSGAARDTYVTANPLGSGTELQQINTQYWIASYLNGPETFANFRRSGFPALTPNPFPSADVPAGTFIRRHTYLTSELSVNTTNLNAAIGRQGVDKLSTKVWWDK